MTQARRVPPPPPPRLSKIQNANYFPELGSFAKEQLKHGWLTVEEVMRPTKSFLLEMVTSSNEVKGTNVCGGIQSSEPETECTSTVVLEENLSANCSANENNVRREAFKRERRNTSTCLESSCSRIDESHIEAVAVKNTEEQRSEKSWSGYVAESDNEHSMKLSETLTVSELVWSGAVLTDTEEMPGSYMGLEENNAYISSNGVCVKREKKSEPNNQLVEQRENNNQPVQRGNNHNSCVIYNDKWSNGFYVSKVDLVSVCNDKKMFVSYEEHESEVSTSLEGGSIKVLGSGTVLLGVLTEKGEADNFFLRKVLYCPDSIFCIVASRSLKEQGCIVDDQYDRLLHEGEVYPLTLCHNLPWLFCKQDLPPVPEPARKQLPKKESELSPAERKETNLEGQRGEERVSEDIQFISRDIQEEENKKGALSVKKRARDALSDTFEGYSRSLYNQKFRKKNSSKVLKTLKGSFAGLEGEVSGSRPWRVKSSPAKRRRRVSMRERFSIPHHRRKGGLIRAQ